MIRYFKKYDTRVRVFTGGGAVVPFEEIFDDSGRPFEWGVLQTSDGYIISELENLIRRNQGGVMEIGHVEYESLKKKEHQKSLPSWRETIQPKQYLRMVLDASRASAAAASRAVAPLPEIVRGMRGEFQNLTRPGGAVINWKPSAVAR